MQPPTQYRTDAYGGVMVRSSPSASKVLSMHSCFLLYRLKWRANSAVKLYIPLQKLTLCT